MFSLDSDKLPTRSTMQWLLFLYSSGRKQPDDRCGHLLRKREWATDEALEISSLNFK